MESTSDRWRWAGQQIIEASKKQKNPEVTSNRWKWAGQRVIEDSKREKKSEEARLAKNRWKSATQRVTESLKKPSNTKQTRTSEKSVSIPVKTRRKSDSANKSRRNQQQTLSTR